MSKRNLLSGTALKTEKGFFYVKNNVRLHIPNRRVLASWSFFKILKVSEEEVAHIPIMGKLGFRDGTLIFCIANAKYYIISNNRAYHVSSPDIIHEHGLKRTDALVVSASDLDLHRRAE